MNQLECLKRFEELRDSLKTAIAIGLKVGYEYRIANAACEVIYKDLNEEAEAFNKATAPPEETPKPKPILSTPRDVLEHMTGLTKAQERKAYS